MVNIDLKLVGLFYDIGYIVVLDGDYMVLFNVYIDWVVYVYFKDVWWLKEEECCVKGLIF